MPPAVNSESDCERNVRKRLQCPEGGSFLTRRRGCSRTLTPFKKDEQSPNTSWFSAWKSLQDRNIPYIDLQAVPKSEQ